MARSTAPKSKAAAVKKPKPSACRQREEVGGSERAKRQRKAVARWSDNPLSALNLGDSRGKLDAAQSGKGGVQGSVSSESAGDSQFPLSDDLLEGQRKTREQEQQQLKRKKCNAVG